MNDPRLTDVPYPTRDLLSVLAALDRLADPDGLVSMTDYEKWRSSGGIAAGVSKTQLEKLNGLGIIGLPIPDPDDPDRKVIPVLERLVQEESEETPEPEKPRKACSPDSESSGKGQVPWRAPKDQGEHMKAIRSSRDLKKFARLIAYEAHVQLGLTSVVEGIPFNEVKRELTPEYLAAYTGLSESKARDYMKEACRLGFFRRVDNGKGGRNNSNRSTYMPTVPAWT